MHRIMIVEDEVVSAVNLEELLVSMGYEVVGKAFSGEQAMEMAPGLRPELILMDIVLPGEVDGIAASEEIVSEIDVPVIFMTGFSNRGFFERSKRIEPSGYILKPFKNDQIKATIEIAFQKKELEKALLESEKKLRQLSSHLIKTQERERRRISLELHDELGQALMVLKLKLGGLERKLPQDRSELREDCEELRQYVDQIIGKVRLLSHSLIPPNIEDLGLSSALTRLTEDIADHLGIESKIDMEEVNHLLSLEAQINIYRIFQEALTNVVKHAQSSLISIVAKEFKDTLTFSVEDDGKGFEIEKAKEGKPIKIGLGLTAMEERVRLLGGSMNIETKKGKGTKVTFSVPIME
ncbi:MAG: response regulator [Desulfobacteraceae bacterium]|nr:response regulator [Desulfobacteraceae bacterium]